MKKIYDATDIKSCDIIIEDKKLCYICSKFITENLSHNENKMPPFYCRECFRLLNGNDENEE